MYTFTFSWGFMDGVVNTHTQQLLGFEFETSQDPFSVFTSVQAFATVIFQLSQTAINTDSGESLQIYTGIVCCIGVVLCSFTFFFDFRYNKAGGQIEVLSDPMEATQID